ncbi:RNA polymerase sigma factor [Oscillibacter sp. 1-3]|uniref:RNA polymerase sigma factor n=1 Tax=Oscillibacter sp. 1-3 TaxID=1235797 RepID=UPI000338F4B6|nr:sigma-70 family RNA polymerase sigma factor [Oscillibacter sp. 1-3]EOS64859.1 sigma-70 family RNA polymerase sigma factor [Oscillibacter sp. 1-3]MCI9510774.1 sigma-70 family RNA polymerase sigma factor [Oscillibacter sp.]
MASLKEELLESYLIGGQERFYRLAYSYLRDREEALDAVQTAVCRCLERRDSLRDEAALGTWFTRILVNTCMDLLRQRRRVTFVPPEALDAGSYEDPLPEDGALADRVNGLPPEAQTVVKLRFYEDMTLREISEVTGWNLNTVKSRLYAGLKKLRVSLEGVTLE